MTAKNNIGRPDDNSTGRALRPYRQGELDALCGVYAIINACRYMLKSAGITKDLGAWELFTTLVNALDERGRFALIACYGMHLKDHNCLLAATEKFLLGKHGLILKVRRPLNSFKTVTAVKAFKIAKTHLQQPGAVALLDFETVAYEHWTVISTIHQKQLYPFDSAGMRSKPHSDFRVIPYRNNETLKKFEFRKSGLILLQIKRL